MADIKFYCPECQQKIAVDDSAAGMQVDCPNCRSALIIPSSAAQAVQIVARGKLVVAGGLGGNAYEELERNQRELAAALDEAAKWRADTERSRAELIRLRGDLAATALERDGLREAGSKYSRLKLEEDRFVTD